MDVEDYEKTLKSFYWVQKKLFSSLSAWVLPKDASTRYKILYHLNFIYVTFWWKFAFNFSLLIQCILKINDLNEVMKVFFMFATVTSVSVKHIAVKFKNKTYQQYVEAMYNPLFRPRNEREVKIFKEAEKISKTVRNGYTLITLLASNGIFLIPFMVHSTELPLAAYVPFNYDSSFRFNIVSLWEWISIEYFCVTNVAFDSIIPSFLIFLNGQLDILHDRLQHLGSDNAPDEVIEERLKECCVNYEEIKTLAQTMEFLSSFAVSIQIMCTVLVFIANFYALAFLYEPDDYANAVKVIIYQTCMLAQIFILCNYANDLSVKSDKVSFAIYQSHWINWNEKNRTLLLIMSMRFHNPIRIRSINPNYYFSLSAFTSIVNSSYTYFALLKNIQN